MSIMIDRYTIFAVLLLSIFLTSCATLLNGTTQNVPVIVPEGTTITDDDNKSYPIFTELYREDTIHYIELRRKYSVPLKFRYKNQEIISRIPHSIEAAWVIIDFAEAIVPFFIDAGSEQWNTYYTVKAVFDPPAYSSSDSSIIRPEPYLQIYDDSKFRNKLGVVVQFGASIISPNQAILFFNNYQIGVGFHYYDKWMIQFAYSTSSYVDFLHNSFITKEADTHLHNYQLEGRYYPYGGLYLSGGGGVRTVIDSAVHKTNIGTAFLGIGYSGKIGYFEWRHTPSFMKNKLLGGTSKVLSTTELNFGFNLFF